MKADPIASGGCPICGAEWIGGHCEPGDEMKEGLRVFYDCGCSVSIREGVVLMKNCGKLLKKGDG